MLETEDNFGGFFSWAPHRTLFLPLIGPHCNTGISLGPLKSLDGENFDVLVGPDIVVLLYPSLHLLKLQYQFYFTGLHQFLKIQGVYCVHFDPFPLLPFPNLYE